MDKPPKAFEDSEFLQSPEGRSVRILSEYEKVKSLFEFHKICIIFIIASLIIFNPFNSIFKKTYVIFTLIDTYTS